MPLLRVFSCADSRGAKAATSVETEIIRPTGGVIGGSTIARGGLTRLAGDGGAALEFRHLYRGSADFAVITKPLMERLVI
jgi:hypothetical protein